MVPTERKGMLGPIVMLGCLREQNRWESPASKPRQNLGQKKRKELWRTNSQTLKAGPTQQISGTKAPGPACLEHTPMPWGLSP